MTLLQVQTLCNVAKAGGITEATRIPPKMQQSSISKQIIALEKDLGTTLFVRRPFALTPDGQKLFDAALPLFEKLEATAAEIRAKNKKKENLTVGAPEIILRDHLERPIEVVSQQFPKTDLEFKDGDETTFPEMLRRNEIDLAVTILDTKPPEDCCVQPLLELPLVLLVPQKSKIKTVKQLCPNDRVEEKLYWLPEYRVITRRFREALKESGIKEGAASALDTIDLIAKWVRAGRGVGVAIAVPTAEKLKGVRVVPLPGFPTVTLGIMWREIRNEPMRAFIAALKASCAGLMPPPK